MLLFAKKVVFLHFEKLQLTAWGMHGRAGSGAGWSQVVTASSDRPAGNPHACVRH